MQRVCATGQRYLRFRMSRLQRRLALFDKFDDIRERNVELPSFGEQGINSFGENLDPFAPGQRRTLIGDKRPGGPAFLDDAGCLQFTIGTGHGVGVHHQPFGQHPNRRHFLSRPKPAGGDEVFDLVDDLLIDRDAIGCGDVDLHGERLSATNYTVLTQ